MITELEYILRDFQVDDFNVSKYSEQEQQLITVYLKKFNTKEKKAFLIAKQHLGTSFHILRSTGYNEWKKNAVSTT
jgi:hypothetical protein